MKVIRNRKRVALAFLTFFNTGVLVAGPFRPAEEAGGSDAISLNSEAITAWAAEVISYQPGEEVDPVWQVPARALGPAEGDTLQVVPLGRGGRLTLAFEEPFSNQPGVDFAVFENAFASNFLELAFVEVSSDGVHFIRFPATSLTPAFTGSEGPDPSDISGLAGKYVAGLGTPFDLSDLPGSPFLDKQAVRFVRLCDVVSGNSTDAFDNVIYDPFPTLVTAGFDCDGVALLRSSIIPLNLTLEGASRVLRWPSEIGISYEVFQSDTLSRFPSSWTLVSEIEASEEETSFEVSTSNEMNFFRVSVSS